MSLHWLRHYQRGEGQGASRHTGRQNSRPGPNILQHSGKVKAEVLVIKVDSRIAVLRVKAHEDRLTKV